MVVVFSQKGVPQPRSSPQEGPVSCRHQAWRCGWQDEREASLKNLKIQAVLTWEDRQFYMSSELKLCKVSQVVTSIFNCDHFLIECDLLGSYMSETTVTVCSSHSNVSWNPGIVQLLLMSSLAKLDRYHLQKIVSYSITCRTVVTLHSVCQSLSSLCQVGMSK